jgi:hypothetical protein
MSEIRYTPNDEPTVSNAIRRQWKTQADFTYSILGNVISIIDLDLGNRSVTVGYEMTSRTSCARSSITIKARSLPLTSCTAILKEFGMESTGTANVLRSLRCAKPKKDKRGRGF